MDGLILAASLVLLHEARRDRAAPALGRCMLWLGIGATIAANALYGATAGPLAAVISTCPAISFIGSVEMAMLLVRRSRTPDTEPTGTARELADAPDTVPVLAPDKAAIPDTAARLRAEGMSSRISLTGWACPPRQSSGGSRRPTGACPTAQPRTLLVILTESGSNRPPFRAHGMICTWQSSRTTARCLTVPERVPDGQHVIDGIAELRQRIRLI